MKFPALCDRMLTRGQAGEHHHRDSAHRSDPDSARVVRSSVLRLALSGLLASSFAASACSSDLQGLDANGTDDGAAEAASAAAPRAGNREKGRRGRAVGSKASDGLEALSPSPGEVQAVSLNLLNCAVEETESACCVAGQQVVLGTAGADSIGGQNGSQCVFGLDGADSVHGGDANDTLVCGGADDECLGEDGHDVLFGGAGNDGLSGGDGHDTLVGGAGDDHLVGGDGHDFLIGGGGDDTLNGGDGKDTLRPGPGRDEVDAGDGKDIVEVFHLCEVESGEVLNGGPGKDTLRTAVPVATLEALGVIVSGFEVVEVIDENAEASECASCGCELGSSGDTVECCGGVGTCVAVVGTGGSCDCPDGYVGEFCEPDGGGTTAGGDGGIDDGADDAADADDFDGDDGQDDGGDGQMDDGGGSFVPPPDVADDGGDDLSTSDDGDTDGGGDTGDDGGSTDDGGEDDGGDDDGALPPDPSDVAPELDPTKDYDFFSANSFLFAAVPQIQSEVQIAQIDPDRMAVVYGTVIDRDGSPLAGVTVRVEGHPEYGFTRTRIDGGFDLAVNGGGGLVLSFVKANYGSVLRRVAPEWNEFAQVDGVALVPRDTLVSLIDFQAPMQVATSSITADDNGSRRVHALFRQGTSAAMELPDGTSVPLSSLHVRMTEYTVGAHGVEAMPLPLPPNTGYTYAVELGVDEAEAASAVSVTFDQIVPVYVDNFLSLPTGTPIPAGVLNREAAAWVSGPFYGRVVEVVSETGGIAVIDADGDGLGDSPAFLAELGIDSVELSTIASLYEPGATFWRVPHQSFSDWDYNLGVRPECDCDGQAECVCGCGFIDGQGTGETDQCPVAELETSSGSIIECHNQVLGESLPIAGTGLSLNYRSSRAMGTSYDRTATFNDVVSPVAPTGLLSVSAYIEVLGRRMSVQSPVIGGLDLQLVWDGVDRYGRVVQGPATGKACVEYLTSLTYYEPNLPADADAAFFSLFGYDGGTTSLGISRPEAVGTIEFCQPIILGNFNQARSNAALGGWSLGVHHLLASAAGVLARGDGSIVRADPLTMIARTASTLAALSLDIGPDGSTYVLHGDGVASATYVTKIAKNGTTTLIAGAGAGAVDGDGGPATAAHLGGSSFGSVRVADTGEIYIAATIGPGVATIRKIGLNGTIETVVGGGAQNPSLVDDLPATGYAFPRIFAMDVASDGGLWFATASGLGLVMRVAPDGRARRMIGGAGCNVFTAGSDPVVAARSFCPSSVDSLVVLPGDRVVFGTHPFAGSSLTLLYERSAAGWVRSYAGGVAPEPPGLNEVALNEALLDDVSGLSWSESLGGLLVLERGPARLRLLNEQGGTIVSLNEGGSGPAGDGEPIRLMKLTMPQDVATTHTGGAWIAESGAGRIRSVERAAGLGAGIETLVPSSDGAAVYVFGEGRRHVRTVDSHTGVTLIQFQYDSQGRLISATDEVGDVVTITRDGDGRATAIVGPDGHTTSLDVSETSQLMSMSDPLGHVTSFTYVPSGLLTSMTNPRGHTTLFGYDGQGRLVTDENALGGSITLLRQILASGYQVSKASPMGRTTLYDVVRSPTSSAQTRTKTRPDGLTETTYIGSDLSTKRTSPDGTIVETAWAADPRFGAIAPRVDSSKVTLPSGLAAVSSESRSATLDVPGQWLTLSSETRATTANGRTATSTYSAVSNTWTSVSPQGRTGAVVLDSKGHAVAAQVADWAGLAVTRDARGRPIEITQGVGLSARTTVLEYDLTSGELVEAVDPLGQSWQFVYDDAGRMVKQILPDGDEVVISYDENSNVVSVTPPSRPSYTTAFDALDRPTIASAPLLTDVPVPQTLVSYNADHQPVEVTRPGGETTTLNYNTITGRLTSVVTPTGTVTPSYDPVTGRVSSVSGPYGVTLSYAYDGPLMLSETMSGLVSSEVSVTYDQNFWPTTEAVDGVPITLAWDNDGLLLSAGEAVLNRHPQRGTIDAVLVGATAQEFTYSQFGELATHRVTHPAFGTYVDPLDPQQGPVPTLVVPPPPPPPGSQVASVPWQPPPGPQAQATVEGTQWQCPDEFTGIPLTAICDGVPDCGLGTDEAYCADGVACNVLAPWDLSTDLLPWSSVCDGSVDCPEGGDESGCFSQLACADGSSAGGGVCDGFEQCDDGSDEFACPFQCAPPGGTLPSSAVCDGVQDCPGGEDESAAECGPVQFSCGIFPWSPKIAPEAVCDGVPDCPEGNDELAFNCTYACGDSLSTIGGLQICDGVSQCADGTDEAGCPHVCGDGTSVAAASLCNGTSECLDSSDESGCDYQCGSGELVQLADLCDGVAECGDGGDESGCPFDCGDGNEVAAAEVCDGQMQCADGSDESSCSTCASQGTCVFEQALTHDDLGRVTRIEETVFGQARVLEVAYDSRGRMTEVKQDGALLESSVYDGASNRVEVEYGASLGGGQATFAYDAQDRLASLTRAGATTTFSYDAAGDLTQRVEPDGDTWTYNYDSSSSLLGVTLPDGSELSYVVDSRGRRVARTVNGLRTHAWAYGNQLEPIAEYDGNGVLVSRFVYASRGHVPDYLMRQGQVYRVVSDHLGSVRLVIHAQTQEVAQRLDYDSWGRVLQDTNPGFQPFGYAGGLYDPLTGLVRFGARDYDPELGRWTTKDPIGFDGGWNWYEYAASAPYDLVDVSGLVPPCATWNVECNVGGLIGWVRRRRGGTAYAVDPYTYSRRKLEWWEDPYPDEALLVQGGEGAFWHWAAPGSAVTLGPVILADSNCGLDSPPGYDGLVHQAVTTVQHEIGHYHQWRRLGPAYLPVVGAVYAGSLWRYAARFAGFNVTHTNAFDDHASYIVQ